MYPAVAQSTDTPGQTVLPSRVQAAAMDSAALRPGNSQRRHSCGRDEEWSYTFLDLTEEGIFFNWLYDLQSWKKYSGLKISRFTTLQHAVVGLPVHLAQRRPEVRRLGTFLHYLHCQRAAFAETQLWWTPNTSKVQSTAWTMTSTFNVKNWAVKKSTQWLRLTFQWFAPPPSCWPLWSCWELCSQSRGRGRPAGCWGGPQSPWTSGLHSSNPPPTESPPLAAHLAHRTNATLLQHTHKYFVFLIKWQKAKREWIREDRNVPLLYSTCINAGLLSLPLVNDKASLEKLQKAGRFLSLRYHHLQNNIHISFDI